MSLLGRMADGSQLSARMVEVKVNKSSPERAIKLLRSKKFSVLIQNYYVIAVAQNKKEICLSVELKAFLEHLESLQFGIIFL